MFGEEVVREMTRVDFARDGRSRQLLRQTRRHLEQRLQRAISVGWREPRQTSRVEPGGATASARRG